MHMNVVEILNKIWSCVFFPGKEKAHKHKSFWPVIVQWGGSPGRVSRGERFLCYLQNPRSINLCVRAPDREDRWPGWPNRVLCAKVLCAFSAREGRSWAIAVRRGSKTSLFLLNSGRFALENYGNSVVNFGSHKTVYTTMAQVLFPLLVFCFVLFFCFQKKFALWWGVACLNFGDTLWEQFVCLCHFEIFPIQTVSVHFLHSMFVLPGPKYEKMTEKWNLAAPCDFVLPISCLCAHLSPLPWWGQKFLFFSHFLPISGWRPDMDQATRIASLD